MNGEDYVAFTAWIYRCHRPLSKRQRESWEKFYAVWFRSAEGQSAIDYLLENNTLAGWKWNKGEIND